MAVWFSNTLDRLEGSADIHDNILYIGVRGFHSRVISSLCVMGLGSRHLAVFVIGLYKKRSHKKIMILLGC